MAISKFHRKKSVFLFNSIAYITVSMSYLISFNRKTSRTFYMSLLQLQPFLILLICQRTNKLLRYLAGSITVLFKMFFLN